MLQGVLVGCLSTDRTGFVQEWAPSRLQFGGIPSPQISSTSIIPPQTSKLLTIPTTSVAKAPMNKNPAFGMPMIQARIMMIRVRVWRAGGVAGVLGVDNDDDGEERVR